MRRFVADAVPTVKLKVQLYADVAQGLTRLHSGGCPNVSLKRR